MNASRERLQQLAIMLRQEDAKQWGIPAPFMPGWRTEAAVHLEALAIRSFNEQGTAFDEVNCCNTVGATPTNDASGEGEG